MEVITPMSCSENMTGDRGAHNAYSVYNVPGPGSVTIGSRDNSPDLLNMFHILVQGKFKYKICGKHL